MRSHSAKILSTAWSILLIAVLLLPVAPQPWVAQAAVQPAPQEVQPPAPDVTNTITLSVYAARTEPKAGVTVGDPVTSYKWMINVDNTGDPFDAEFPDCSPYLDPPTNTVRNTAYPDSCDMPAVRTVPGWSPIYTQGTEADLNDTVGVTLPDGKYLLSILADGYKNDGIHFTVPLEDPGLLEVGVQPLPLPPATITIKVFDDRVSTNGQYDAPVEAGLAGFRASINDTMGEITTDLFGNPICTVYEKDANGDVLLDPDGAPIIQTLGNGCYSDEEGIISIPNVGTIRFDVLVIPPDGTHWIQTTTLEGSQGWDTWLQEAGTGMDNEFVVSNEPFPWTIFGFVQPTSTLPIDGGQTVKGYVMAANVYTPFEGGLPYLGQKWGGLSGAKIDKPISDAWLSLNDLQNGDQAVWVGMANADGYFEIPHVPPGNYFLTYWDEKQHYILDWVQVTVEPGKDTDLGVLMLTGWFAEFYGTVFNDLNENGRQDPGEPGIPNYLVVLKDRDNSEIDRMSIASTTDANGKYAFEKGYPMTFWMILEAYSDLYYTTGITFQASNQLTETTVLGSGVDVGVLPIIGQKGRLDWGVKAYDHTHNGGIVGTVFYDTMRAEDDAAYAGAEPYQPGIPNMVVNLYEAQKDAQGNFLKDPVTGAYLKGPKLNTTVTETYIRPKDCTARDVSGKPVAYSSALPPYTGGFDCLEGPMMGLQFDEEFATLDGNYGFTTIFTPSVDDPAAVEVAIPAGDYLVEVETPTDQVFGRPLLQVTREEDVNIYTGDVFYPDTAPPPCAGPLHTVDVAGSGADGPDAVVNPGYAEAGGSRFEGQQKPMCDVKLVTLLDGRSIAPIFNFFTEVPIPGRWRGYIIDDLNLSTNPLELTFGEKAGLPYMPIGVYDFTGRLVHRIDSDRHGVYEIILPSAATYNAPTPSGILANVYYIYGNDPGAENPTRPNYSPQYRSIGTSFEIYPGVIEPSDLAPVTNGVWFKSPGSQLTQPAYCKQPETAPQIFSVPQPYHYYNPNAGTRLTITGIGFGLTRGRVLLNTRSLPVVNNGWTDTSISVNIPSNLMPGVYQLTVETATGAKTVNGLSYHIIGNYNGFIYQPTVFEVGPGKTYDPANPIYDGTARGPIQHAIDDAIAANGNDLIVVYPGEPAVMVNPKGWYMENLVMYAPVKLQGVGPGGVYSNGTSVPGTIIDGRAVGGDTPYTTWWRTELLPNIWFNLGGWDGSVMDGDGNPIVNEGSVITILAKDGEFGQTYRAAIDGLVIQGGDQQGFPNNLNPVGGGQIPGVPANVTVQGGGIYALGYARYLQIKNNIIWGNGGSYASAIRLGTPHLTGSLTDAQNDWVLISNNRILANGGTNLAGSIGLFNGAERYEIAYNDICGNYSAEYGGGISHYGYSPFGKIHDNRIYFNIAYDEGGGIMIAGELPADPNALSVGAGPVNVYNNLLQSNMSNDDGGGLRFLMSGNFEYEVYNNFIVNNISTHEGGGISINDAPNVRIMNNTIMKNITTATAMTSNGLPAPAGLSSSRNSLLLQATLPVWAPNFSNPLLFNNIFWDNRAGAWDGAGVAGIGLPGDPNAINHWDLGLSDNIGILEPTDTLLQVNYQYSDPSNIVGQDPLVVGSYDTKLLVLPWRGNPNFIGALLVGLDLPPELLGDYHLLSTSPVINQGAAQKAYAWEPLLERAPGFDIDNQGRPSWGGYEFGADETVMRFPGTGLLFSVREGTGLTSSWAEASGPYTAFLPALHTGVGTPLTGQWAGELDSFAVGSGSVKAVKTGYVVWDGATFGASQEAYLTLENQLLTTAKQGLLLNVEGLEPGGMIGASTRLIAVNYDAAAHNLLVETLTEGQVWQELARFEGVSLRDNDILGARTLPSGLVEIYLNSALVGRVDLEGAFQVTGGKIGVWYVLPDGKVSAGFDNFGGGTLP